MCLLGELASQLLPVRLSSGVRCKMRESRSKRSFEDRFIFHFPQDVVQVQIHEKAYFVPRGAGILSGGHHEKCTNRGVFQRPPHNVRDVSQKLNVYEVPYRRRAVHFFECSIGELVCEFVFSLVASRVAARRHLSQTFVPAAAKLPELVFSRVDCR